MSNHVGYDIDYRGYHKQLGHIDRWLNLLCTQRCHLAVYQILIRKFYIKYKLRKTFYRYNFVTFEMMQLQCV